MKDLPLLVGVLFSLSGCRCEGESPVSNEETAPTVREKRAEKPAFKGMELYSWQEGDGQWRFSLLPGTNRLKPIDMVMAKGVTVVGVRELKAKLRLLAKGENVFWFHRVNASKRGEYQLSYPPEKMIVEIAGFCGKLDIELSVPKEIRTPKEA